MNGKLIRLEKLFSKNQNAVIVAVDHGMFDGPIPGMINLEKTMSKINPVVDAILLSPGMLSVCKHAFNFKGAPIPIVRINWSSVYCFHWNYNDAFTVAARTVEQAVSEGAEIVLISLTMKTGSEERDAKNVEVYCQLKNEADRLGIPVIGEFFPTHSAQITSAKLHDQVYTCCRILSELGTDCIKTFYTEKFKEVTEGCPVPIFGLGAERKPTQLEALELARNEIRDGAKGVVFGRNAIQVNNPFDFQAALSEVVKDNMDPSQAVSKYQLTD